MAPDNSAAPLNLEDVSTPASPGCGCGGEHGSPSATEGAYPDQSGAPVLDARAIPHAYRHAAVFAAIADVPPTGSLILVAPHDPLPLLAQLHEREGDAIGVEYDVRGPEYWRLRLTRHG